MVFLKAHWRDLIIASYAVDRDLLERRLPPGLKLDLFEGRAVCSLVGFGFHQTRVLGVRWPGYVNFPEINLRFYVKEQGSDRRGVVFIRELVRSRFVAGMAKGIYNEPYVKARIIEQIEDDVSTRKVRYEFEYNQGVGRMVVESDSSSTLPHEQSTEHWFKEHQWGYGITRSGKALRYEVQHPHWACHEVRSSTIDVDWGTIYGDEWAPMRDAHPLNVVHAKGSGIKVFGAQKFAAYRDQ